MKSYNSLPLELRNAKEFKDFKHRLKLFLLVNSSYSLQEFTIQQQNNNSPTNPKSNNNKK
jgi:hypothetical protein